MTVGRPKKTEDKRITPGFLAQAGKGRPKGVKNKLTMQVKEMILAALDKAGGIEYLAHQADENPSAFLSLVGKVLPLQVTNGDEPFKIEITRRIVSGYK